MAVQMTHRCLQSVAGKAFAGTDGAPVSVVQTPKASAVHVTYARMYAVLIKRMCAVLIKRMCGHTVRIQSREAALVQPAFFARIFLPSAAQDARHAQFR